MSKAEWDTQPPLLFIVRSMTRYVLLAGLLMAGTLASCGDPMSEKEEMYGEIQDRQRQDWIKNGRLVESQDFTFTTPWLRNTEQDYLVPSTEVGENVANSYWASASNAGYRLVIFAGVGDEDSWPLSPLTDAAGNITAARIRSVKGFFIPGLAGTRVVAGSLYSGQVDADRLAIAPLESTLFGQPYTTGTPEELEITYQYKAGPTVIHGQERQMELPAQDRGSVSAVFYETTDDDSFLNGNTLQTDKRIVAKVYRELEPTPGSDWQTLKLRLEPVDQARYDSVDFTKKKYRLALVFSSSFRGAEYIGAVGSELLLQRVKISDRVKYVEPATDTEPSTND